ncbi:di-heme oxidoredictase family protein [Marinomonas algicola]|uniref:di-heme oxidoreductase family protein n=1 Tax=Marinomonas algicola TaxID=2773454 RepID=UPI00174E3353|nr:di-heme oxidoredictase family protein [Marinomonas algicola]
MTQRFYLKTSVKAGIFASLVFFHPLGFPETLLRNGANSTEESDFSPVLGKAIFEKLWASSPSSTLASDGLGPLFNARSCHSCHLNEGGGKRPKQGDSTSKTTAFFIRLGLTQSDNTPIPSQPISVWPDPHYGHQLQNKSIQGLLAEPSFSVEYLPKPVRFSDGTNLILSKPIYRLDKIDTNRPRIDKHTGISARLTPHLTGMGLIDAIPESAILALADPNDLDGDGISGRVNTVWDRNSATWRVGKFGFKATQPTLDQQNQSAFNGDIGLSTPLFPAPSGDCTAQQTRCLEAPNGNTPHIDNLEINQQQLNWVNLYLASLPVNRIKNTQNPIFDDGKQHFIKLNCIACHTPKFTTADSTISPSLENRVILPFSDFLLHDMGNELASGFSEYAASHNEWRTSPLWGISTRLTQNPTGGFLHDGRARTVNEAILWHGGEAAASRAAFMTLPKHDRKALLYFLESL